MKIKMQTAVLATALGLSGTVLAQSPTMFVSATNTQLILAGLVKTHLPVVITPSEAGATYILQVTHDAVSKNGDLTANCSGSFDGGGQLIVQTGFKTVHSADCAAAQKETGVQLLDGRTHAVIFRYTVADENDKSVGTGAAKRLSTYFRTQQ